MDKLTTKSAYGHMIRFRTPGGRVNSAQLRASASALDDLGLGKLHFTTRASLEFHHQDPDVAEELKRRMAEAGLGNNGACGPVVRGAAVSTPLHPHAEKASDLAGKILAHFRGRGEFSSLPRKFKVGVDAGYHGSRRLIQDAGFVRTGQTDSGESLYDLWLAGGLGREPVPAFHFRAEVPESVAIALLEAVVTVFRDHGQPRKRLKHLVLDRGRDWFCERIAAAFSAPLPGSPPLPAAAPEETERNLAPHVLLPLFAGQASAEFLRTAADLADKYCAGTALLTPDQDVALVPLRPDELENLTASAELAGLEHSRAENHFAFRICPGGEHCPKALCETLELAGKLRETLAKSGMRSAALSGCPNSCAQPQLADIGILCVKRTGKEDGFYERRYRILKNNGKGFSETVSDGVGEESLGEMISRLI